VILVTGDVHSSIVLNAFKQPIRVPVTFCVNRSRATRGELSRVQRVDRFPVGLAFVLTHLYGADHEAGHRTGMNLQA
jgi:hypothetical protein